MLLPLVNQPPRSRMLPPLKVLKQTLGHPLMKFIMSLFAKLLQSCLTLCNSMDYSPPGSSVHADSPGKNTGVGCHALLQGIFPTQGLKPHLLWLLHCQQILYHWATQETWDPVIKDFKDSPVFLPGEFHGQRSLAGYSLWGCKESDTTERLSLIQRRFKLECPI